MSDTRKIRVTVWNEFRHEQQHEAVRAVYPEGIHRVIGEHLRSEAPVEITYATLDQDADHGLSQAVLDNTDVLIWWGHIAHPLHHGGRYFCRAYVHVLIDLN